MGPKITTLYSIPLRDPRGFHRELGTPLNPPCLTDIAAVYYHYSWYIYLRTNSTMKTWSSSIANRLPRQVLRPCPKKIQENGCCCSPRGDPGSHLSGRNSSAWGNLKTEVKCCQVVEFTAAFHVNDGTENLLSVDGTPNSAPPRILRKYGGIEIIISKKPLFISNHANKGL